MRSQMRALASGNPEERSDVGNLASSAFIRQKPKWRRRASPGLSGRSPLMMSESGINVNDVGLCNFNAAGTLKFSLENFLRFAIERDERQGFLCNRRIFDIINVSIYARSSRLLRLVLII